MNNKVIIIFILTFIALIVLFLYSFGPLSGKRNVHSVNPVSMKPTPAQPVTLDNKPQVFNAYHNKDSQENYYTVKFPADWQVEAGKKPGGYALHYSSTSGTAELMDVPDNSTLELYILSQDEPNLKKTLTVYNRIDYAKSTINNIETYQLVYTTTINNEIYQTMRTYFTGADQAAVITLSTPQADYDRLKETFTTIINSFQWENK